MSGQGHTEIIDRKAGCPIEGRSGMTECLSTEKKTWLRDQLGQLIPHSCIGTGQWYGRTMPWLRWKEENPFWKKIGPKTNFLLCRTRKGSLEVEASNSEMRPVKVMLVRKILLC